MGGSSVDTSAAHVSVVMRLRSRGASRPRWCGGSMAHHTATTTTAAAAFLDGCV